MKKVAVVLLLIILCCTLAACFDGVITESKFFFVMTTINAYPENYTDMTLEFDCFTYNLQDVNGKTYICGVRHCSAAYGCTCGNDTIIGFVLEYNVELPEPRNQSDESQDKTWVHLKGKLKNTDKLNIEIRSYIDGKPDPNNTEQIQLLVFVVESCTVLTEQEYSSLNRYVNK